MLLLNLFDPLFLLPPLEEEDDDDEDEELVRLLLVKDVVLMELRASVLMGNLNTLLRMPAPRMLEGMAKRKVFSSRSVSENVEDDEDELEDS